MKAVCVFCIYLTFFVTYSFTKIGTVLPESIPNFWLPMQMLVFILAPFILGYLTKKELGDD